MQELPPRADLAGPASKLADSVRRGLASRPADGRAISPQMISHCRQEVYSGSTQDDDDHDNENGA